MFSKTGGIPVGKELPYQGKLPNQSAIARFINRFRKPWVIVELTNPGDGMWYVAYRPARVRVRKYREHKWLWYRASATYGNIDIAQGGRVWFA